MNEVSEFTVDGETWYRGHGGAGSALLLDDGSNKKCCVGFYCVALNFDPKDISGETTFNGAIQNFVGDYSEHWAAAGEMADGNDGDIAHIYAINDDKLITDIERIAKLKPLFAKNGVTIRFINVPGYREAS